MADDIASYVRYNNKLRGRGGVYSLIGKNNNNTLYGRIGMATSVYKAFEITSARPDSDLYKEIGGLYISYNRSTLGGSNPAVSAAIASKARIKLYHAIFNKDLVGARLLYTDTDSLVFAVKKEAADEYIDKHFGNIHFDSGLRSTIIVDAVFALPKTYAVRTKDGSSAIKMKGMQVDVAFNKFK